MKQFLALFVFLASAFVGISEDIRYQYSFEELANVTVTTVTGTEERLLETPSAISILTADEIKEQGHRTVADALRSIPGVHVGQINSSNYAVATRGFSDRLVPFSLVLIDGRSVYTPLFSGVFWDIQDLILDDIERIEIIRGPGATLWGANAVNGVINIITKSSFETQGGLLKAGVGTFEQGFLEFRQGEIFNEQLAYRLWGKAFNRDSTVDIDDNDRPDDWSYLNGGFRIDYEPNLNDTLTFQGKVAGTNNYGEGSLRPDPNPPIPQFFPAQVRPDLATESHVNLLNYYLLFDWTRDDLDEGFTLKTYYDFESRDLEVLDEELGTFDIEFRQWWKLNHSNKLLYGLGYRFISANFEPSHTITFRDQDPQLHYYNFFIQNTTKVNDRLSLIYGSKFEYNELTAENFQPSLRLNYLLNEHNQLWASVSRALRTPSIGEDSIMLRRTVDVGGGLNANAYVAGNRDLENTELISYELGYRSSLNENLSLDIAIFFNDYDHLTSINQTTDPLVVQFSTMDNQAKAYGMETQLKWQILDSWHLTSSYSYFNLEIASNSQGSLDVSEGYSPSHLANFSSTYSFTDDFLFHCAAYYYDNSAYFDIPAYIRLDAGITWHINSQLELQLWGQNLTEPSHLEFKDDVYADEAHQIERSFYMQVSYKF